jgi:hypothetical protein
MLGADKLVVDEEHYFPREKKLKQPARRCNSMQRSVCDEFINEDLEIFVLRTVFHARVRYVISTFV